MVGWGYTFTLGAMCKSSHLSVYLSFSISPHFVVYISDVPFTHHTLKARGSS